MLITTLAESTASALDSAISPAAATGASGVSALARAKFLRLSARCTEQAAQRYGLDWAILAGIGKVECDHGRDPDPSCTQRGRGQLGRRRRSDAVPRLDLGAATASTATATAAATAGTPADAIFSAANYLRASGAPGDYRRAIFAYNHAGWYVAEVERWAAQLPRRGRAAQAALAAGRSERRRRRGSQAGESPTPVRFVAGERAQLLTRRRPSRADPRRQRRRGAGDGGRGQRAAGSSVWPGGHPDPRGASKRTARAPQLRPLPRRRSPDRRNPQREPARPGLRRTGALPGPGAGSRSTRPTSPTPHVFIVIAGLRLDTSHNGTDVGPNRDEDGPRWRIFDHIPTWAHWSVRHPPGL